MIPLAYSYATDMIYCFLQSSLVYYCVFDHGFVLLVVSVAEVIILCYEVF